MNCARARVACAQRVRYTSKLTLDALCLQSRPQARARARWLCSTTLLAAAATLCTGAPLCEQPGLLRTVVSERTLCLDTASSGRLVLNTCNPAKASQWWEGRPGSAQLVQSDSLSKAARSSIPYLLGATAGVCADDHSGLTTSACPVNTTTESTRFSFTADEAQHIRFRDQCLSVADAGGRTAPPLAISRSACEESTAVVWEQTGCRPLPALFDAEHNWARGAPAIVSSTIGGSGGGGTSLAVTDGFPDTHGWSHVGCGGIHSGERDDELHPWVTIDLQRRVAVSTVQIWTRPACTEYSSYLCQNRLWHFSIFVGDEPPPAAAPELGTYSVNGPPCAVVTDSSDDVLSVPRGMYVNVPCAQNKAGRYVTVQQMQSLDVALPGVMNLCQIRVFGSDLTPSPPPAPPHPPPPLAPRPPSMRVRLSTALRQHDGIASPLVVENILHRAGWCTGASSHRRSCAVVIAAIEAFIMTALLALCMNACQWVMTTCSRRSAEQSLHAGLQLPVTCPQALPSAADKSLRRAAANVRLFLRRCAPQLSRRSTTMTTRGTTHGHAAATEPLLGEHPDDAAATKDPNKVS